MSMRWRLSRWASVVLFAPLLFGQEVEKKIQAPPSTERVWCEPDACVGKVFHLPNFPTSYDLKDVEIAFRLIVQTPLVSSSQSEHTVSFRGTTEQLAIADELVNVLENLKSSGSRNTSSVLVYEPLPRKVLEQSSIRQRCELTNCFIEAVYLPDFSVAQLQGAVNKLHVEAQVGRICMVPSSHTIVFQVTRNQLSLAEGLLRE